MTSKKKTSQPAAKTSQRNTAAQQNEKLSEEDWATVAKELSNDELKDLSGGGLGEAI